MIEKTGSGYLLKGEDTNLNILFYSERIVRFAYSQDAIPPASTIAVQAKLAEINATVESSIIKSPYMTIIVNPKTLTVTIEDLSGSVINEDIAVLPGRIRVEKKKLWEKGIYGNGEKYTWLNQMGVKTENYNSDVLFHEPLHHPLVEEMHTAIPFYIGAAPDQAYGIYFDNSYRTWFDFASNDKQEIGFGAQGGHIDYFFLYGPSVAEVVQNYVFLTGAPPLPGKKFLGYHQSRYSYETQEELLSIAAKLRDHDLPCDVLYLDIAYMEAYKVFTVNRERFADFKGMLERLKEMGYVVVIIVNPGVKVEEGYRVYEEGRRKGYFVTEPGGAIYEGEVWPKPAAYPDFLRAEVRQWWGDFHRELLACGVEAIWNDMNEPADFTRQSATLPDDAVHLTDEGEKRPHAEVHNIYGLLQTQATREALERLEPTKRPFVLTRAAFAGSQRYAALWTGDNASVWEHLEASVPMILNLGLSGYSFTGADVGGYQGDCSGELLVRWTQLGAFLPFFRNHSEIGTARQEPWAYPEEFFTIIRKYIHLRYRLLTYFYNLMRESSLTGAPAARPLFYHYQDDPETYNLSDQFLLGEHLMVCPVLRPGQKRRLVYLPRGTWYDFWSEEKLTGNSFITSEAPLETIPLYIKAGTILPYDEPVSGKNTQTATNAKLTMRCYGGGDGYYRLYIDDGASNLYREGRYSEVEFVMRTGAKGPAVEMKTLVENYPLPEILIDIRRR